MVCLFVAIILALLAIVRTDTNTVVAAIALTAGVSLAVVAVLIAALFVLTDVR